VLVAGPEDIKYSNVNSLVCSKELAHDRSNDLFRFIGWWFDILNCFRRSTLFEETRDPALHNRLVQTILAGIHTDAGHIALMPPGATAEDVEAMLDLMRIRSSSDVGNYMFPNMQEAQTVRTALIENLARLDAVVELLPKVAMTDPLASPPATVAGRVAS
jgi:hypothetical protein